MYVQVYSLHNICMLQLYSLHYICMYRCTVHIIYVCTGVQFTLYMYVQVDENEDIQHTVLTVTANDKDECKLHICSGLET